MYPFAAGDKVEHLEFGRGVVIQWQPAKLLVKWEKSGKVSLVPKSEVQLIKEEEHNAQYVQLDSGFQFGSRTSCSVGCLFTLIPFWKLSWPCRSE